MLDPKLTDEEARLSALHRYAILDTPAESPFDKITDLVRTVLQVPIATVSLIDRDRQWLKAASGIDRGQCARDESFCTHTIRAHAPMLIPDALLDERFATNPSVVGDPHIRSYAGVPLTSPDGYNLGSLCAIDQVPRAFDAGQVAILQRFAAIIVDEMELRQIAARDQLTGALTRRGFIAFAEAEMARSARHSGSAAMMLIDIDHFKAVNDTHGHPGGDAVLRAVAAQCVEATRATDAFGRIGGEEFALLLHQTTLEQARMIAERWRAMIAETDIALGSGTVRVTASIGVAALDPAITTVDQWMAAADRPLYAAKHGGRNRVCVAVPAAA